ncbi:MAG TPA: Ppx/GppA family phosphatase, partial [Candidatus Latescibacteria bacterium]|nr:Ppx/GppA family phosphatase [Candidatus Latescibacterota bacterium]
MALTERFVRKDPPSNRDIDALRVEIDAQLSTISWITKSRNAPLVGLGGT